MLLQACLLEVHARCLENSNPMSSQICSGCECGSRFLTRQPCGRVMSRVGW